MDMYGSDEVADVASHSDRSERQAAAGDPRGKQHGAGLPGHGVAPKRRDDAMVIQHAAVAVTTQPAAAAAESSRL